MGSLVLASQKPHAVCIPYPAQGHLNPMLKFAKLLHQKGFHITFVNTEFNHQRLLRSRGPHSLDGLPSFRFETIPDGMPPSNNNADSTQDIPSLCESTTTRCLVPFKLLLAKLNNDNVPPVTCIVSDGIMAFTIDVAEQLGIPEVLFWTTSACGFYGYLQYPKLLHRGITPLKDESYISNGYLDTVIDWIPAMKNIRLKDLPTFFRTTNSEDFMLNFAFSEVARAKRASAIFFNTFEELEHDVLHELSLVLPPIYSIGPLQCFHNQLEDKDLKSIESNLWKEESECIEWLDTKEPNSVVYVNFGSIVVMTPDQLVEFSWGLANSKQTFLWIIRSDLVSGDSAILPAEFIDETKERGLLASWCPQEQVLCHPSIGGFLTHNGWNSTIESISSGVPMICWPIFAEQQTNSWFSVNEWGVGMEIDNNVKRDEVDRQVRELMCGEKGREMKEKAIEWMRKGEEASNLGGTSYMNLDKMIHKVLLAPTPRRH